jgi:Fe-S cluster assembly scaffold protein SufB
MATRLTEFKSSAMKQFEELENPSFRYGLGIHVQPNELTFSQEADDSLTILKANGATVIEGHEEPYDEIGSLVNPKENKILAKHYSTIKKTFHIIIPEETLLERPVVIASNQGSNRFEQIFIEAKKGSKATVLIKVNKESEYNSQVIETLVHSNANLSVQYFIDTSETGNNFCYRGSKVMKDGELNWTDVIIGGNFAQIISKCNLEEEGATYIKRTATFSNSSQQMDIFDSVNHHASYTNSIILSRSVVDQESKTIYRGKIHVNKNSQGCSAHQKSENLLLDKNSRCNAVPILEVSNDDISCSHGASFTNIDVEKLFYLNSRGFQDEAARNLIVSGFIEPMITQFCLEQAQDHIRERVGEKIHGN